MGDEVRAPEELGPGPCAALKAIGKDATALNASAQQLAARKRTPDEMVKDGELLAGLDELQDSMTKVLAAAEQLAADVRATDFEDLASKVVFPAPAEILAARREIDLLKVALVRAVPRVRAS